VSWFHGWTIVITGASSGFGKGVALKLAGQDLNLVLAARGEAARAVLTRCRRGDGIGYGVGVR
jgi:NADP-dependent 3-hydroxy acid dehydrogenase YdfG